MADLTSGAGKENSCDDKIDRQLPNRRLCCRLPEVIGTWIGGALQKKAAELPEPGEIMAAESSRYASWPQTAARHKNAAAARLLNSLLSFTNFLSCHWFFL